MTVKRSKPTPALTDPKLGEDRVVPRRDFLQGALFAAASTLSGRLLASPAAGRLEASRRQDLPDYYPPAWTGLRGSHPGSYEAAHALRDGTYPRDLIDNKEHFDLVVVGGGISGLSAAHFFRESRGKDARILILDNHDDFGGHAKRNEFRLGGRLLLMNGGTLDIDSPRPYSAVAAGLIEQLGIDVDDLSRRIENDSFYESRGLKAGIFLDRDTFGSDFLAVGIGSAPVSEVLALSPLPARVRRDIERVEEGNEDYFPNLTSGQKKAALARMSYRDFLQDVVKVAPLTIAFYQTRTHGEWGVGIDAVSALDCWGMGLAGFKGLQLEQGAIARMGYTPAGYADTGGSKTLHFPDGNATIARLLVRRLIPNAVPGDNVDDVITARVRYDRLDSPASTVRLRLNSTAVRVQHYGAGSAPSGVTVTYLQDGKACVVRAGSCVLACWNAMIPFLCPELPERQKNALHKAVKTPLVYTSVALRNWAAFQKLGVFRISAPGGYHSHMWLNEKVDIGRYRSSVSPDQPILLHMLRVPCRPGLSEHEQNKAGRAELLDTPFATFERHIRAQLAQILGPGGFDPAKDIQAITVNRWPHGYAPEYNPLFDPDRPESERPNVIGRARFGRIAIANSDSGAAAFTDSAIDQAHRAIGELEEI
jgi:spermidine dehydrogenase